jgi:Helicase conserved C-terminal domain
MNRPDTASVLAGLKDFQRRTVDHVYDRLYGPEGARRFLVADEVGLGKTLIAKGIIARTIDHWWSQREHIDIIYICSNADIARQNIARLKIPGCGDEEMQATRLSLLPLYPRQRSASKVNFIALTPGTSFDVTQGGGEARERAVLYRLLQQAWALGTRKAPTYVLAEYGAKSFHWHLQHIGVEQLDPVLLTAFTQHLAAQPELRAEFEALCQGFHASNAVIDATQAKRRGRWIGAMRRELTRVCIASMQPTLIIMDEFQRFRDLLNPETEAGTLAAALEAGPQGARTLLLSATPYKMLSLHHEQAEDHFDELLNTLTYLDAAGSASRADWQQRFRTYQSHMLQLQGDTPAQWQSLAQQRDDLAHHLRRVMVRTERLAAARETAGMLKECDLGAMTLGTQDVRAWLGLQAIADELKQGDCIEYWKSAPYVLNFMDRYQLSEAFHAAVSHPATARQMHKLVSKHSDCFLPMDRIARYQKVPPAHARLRALQRETLEADQWKLLWIPPALPHYQLAGPFSTAAARTLTKSLIFSAWHVVPKALAALLSYEAERLAAPRGVQNTAEARKRRRGRLVFTQSTKDRVTRSTGMPLLLLVYPSLTLATLGDPAEMLRLSGQTHPSLKVVLAQVRSRLDAALAPLLTGRVRGGAVDERWYWAAPLLLDQIHHPQASERWWTHEALDEHWTRATGKDAHALDADEQQAMSGWDKHVTEARVLLEAKAGHPSDAAPLGRVPADLLHVLSEAALAAPAVCALRAFERGDCAQDVTTRLAAGRVGHAFLSLFNVPEVQALLHGLNAEEPYWRRVLDYLRDGGVQAVLDEFVHLLREDRQTRADRLSREICEVLRMRASPLRVEHITAPEGKRRVAVNADESIPHDEPDEHHRVGMRARFAMRFGDDRGDSEKGGARKEVVRQAFNSPFWPFVLVSTSVGQEGLDFHRYCHRVIHWNLPSNPVDLEQREGRIHRYKGHAVRKNVSTQHRTAAIAAPTTDLWQAAFQAAAAARPAGDSELTPYWLYPGEAKIERCVPNLPMSREITKLQTLRRALTVYRMAFGHARQEDVLEHLLASVPEGSRAALSEALALDLSPAGKPEESVI